MEHRQDRKSIRCRIHAKSKDSYAARINPPTRNSSKIGGILWRVVETLRQARFRFVVRRVQDRNEGFLLGSQKGEVQHRHLGSSRTVSECTAIKNCDSRCRATANPPLRETPACGNRCGALSTACNCFYTGSRGWTGRRAGIDSDRLDHHSSYLPSPFTMLFEQFRQRSWIAFPVLWPHG